MLKLSSLLIPAVAATAALWWSAPTAATLMPNGYSNQGLAPSSVQLQGLAPNGTYTQGRSRSGLTTSFMTLHAVRLALPDGTELTFH
jgi:hypothetical protein